MSEDRMIWVDLGRPGCDIFLASFEEPAQEKAILIRTDKGFANDQKEVLSAAGFVSLRDDETLWGRSGGIFRMREFRAAFPEMHAREMPTRKTRLLVKGPSPFASGLAGGAEVTQAEKRKDPRKPNGFQVPYRPASRLGDPVAMVPINMDAPLRASLERIVQTHGPIDEFVARALDVTLHEIEKMLSPEQIDAVAAGLDSTERDRELILADQTGLGKGRVLAALALAAIVAGKRVIFVTEKANLFSDFWRDIMDIGADQKFGRPFLLNDGARILDFTTGKVLFEAGKSEEIKRQLKSGALPAGCKVLFSTYSQFNRVNSLKSKFLAEISQGAVAITDEGHNAGGDSATQKVLSSAFQNTSGIIRSSATFVRRAAALLAYPKVLPPSLRTDEAADTLELAGVSLAEVISQYLAEDGVLMRRESDLSGISMNLVIDEERRPRNRAFSDALAPILERMARLSRMVDDEIENRNEEAEQAGGKSAKEKWYSASFGSRLSPLLRQFIVAITVDLCVERCVQALLENRKPVVVIENTMETLMRELAGEAGASGEGEDDTAEGASPPDFRAALLTMLDRTMHMSVRRGKDDPEKIEVDDPFCVAEADQIRRMINEFPDLSLSPIDDVIERVEKEGERLHIEGKIDRPWRMGEISARKMRVHHGVYEPISAVDRNQTIFDFNNGGLDGLLITKAASTGLSLHAAKTAKDQRIRRMVEWQIVANVVERIQFWGRINRRGQTSLPEFETLCSGLPLQMRIMAMENRKVASLSANVSANASNAAVMDVPDVIDSVGNEVAHRILEEQPKLAERMCIAMRVDPETAEQELYFVNKLLQRLCMLSSDEQDAVFARLVEDYEDALAALKAQGRSPRGTRELEGEWVEISRRRYEDGNPEDGPVFGRAVELVTREREVEANPITTSQVENMVAASRKRLGETCGKAAGPYFSEQVEQIKKRRRKVLNASLGGRFISVDSALKSSGPNAVKNAEERLSKLTDLLVKLQPGMGLNMPAEEGQTVSGFVVDIIAPDEAELHLPGRWIVKFAVPGEQHTKQVSLAAIIRDPAYRFHPLGAGGLPDMDFRAFDRAPRGVLKEQRDFLDGNLVRAVMTASEVGAGSLVTYTNDTGEKLRSVLVSRRGMQALINRSKQASSGREAVEIMRNGGVVFTNSVDRASGIVVRKENISFAISLPRGKEGKAVEQALDGISGPFRSQGGQRIARISEERIERAMEALLEMKMRLHFDAPRHAIPSSQKEEPRPSPQQRAPVLGKVPPPPGPFGRVSA